MALARRSADPERDTTGLSHHSPARNPVPSGTPFGVLAGQPKDQGLSRGHAATRVTTRNTNRAHRPTAGRATPLARAADDILGTYDVDGRQRAL
jgi:hypothetical protein